jgi:hypothetical protein
VGWSGNKKEKKVNGDRLIDGYHKRLGEGWGREGFTGTQQCTHPHDMKNGKVVG